MRATNIALPVLVAVSITTGCAQSPEQQSMPEAPYHDICYTSRIIIDHDELQDVLNAHGVDYLYGLADLGSCPLMVRGSQETLFLARELVARCVREQGLKVSWPADSIVLMNEWDQIGFDKGPWIRLASVEHRVTPTETILSRLNDAGIPTLFIFGETSDFVLVKTVDASASTAILRKVPDAAIQIHNPRTCVHVPPPFIRKGTPTSLTLLISAADTGRPLRERVTDPTCFYRLPEAKQTVGYWMTSEERPDGTLVATYELPPIPSEVQGFVGYSFTFNLDGRRFWHGDPSEPFRVPLR